MGLRVWMQRAVRGDTRLGEDRFMHTHARSPKYVINIYNVHRHIFIPVSPISSVQAGYILVYFGLDVAVAVHTPPQKKDVFPYLRQYQQLFSCPAAVFWKQPGVFAFLPVHLQAASAALESTFWVPCAWKPFTSKE